MNPTHIDVVTKKCFVCDHTGMVENVSVEGLKMWNAGAFIQVALPELSAGDREQLLTGTHSACFDMLFPEEDEDD